MKILIDTHIYLWALSTPERIPSPILAAVKTAANTIFVSAICIAEIALKSSMGKLQVSFDPVSMIERCGFEKLDFRCEDAAVLKELPFHHKDPFDRMLIAQSLANDFPIATVDEKIKAYGCRLI